MKERIQKIIAAAGITSRRRAEKLILEGRVMVNGQVVTELGTKADVSTDHIKVDGRPLKSKKPPIYLILNKPENYLTTLDDPKGRPTIVDLVEDIGRRVYPVGRLDWDTEGLLLLTDDGEFANQMSHPRYQIKKTYLAKVNNVPNRDAIYALRNGVLIDSGKTAPCKVSICSQKNPGKHTWLEIAITEGKNRQIRQMIETVGHDVLRLKRVSFGPQKLGALKKGKYRKLTIEEIELLKEAASGK